jgi:toxin ParE1/3/4
VKLRLTPRAVADIAEIADYINVHNPEAAQRVRSTLYGAMRRLILFPRLGRPQRTEGVRKLVTSRFSYLIYYTLTEHADEIVILSVRHAARQREHTDR